MEGGFEVLSSLRLAMDGDLFLRHQNQPALLDPGAGVGPEFGPVIVQAADTHLDDQFRGLRVFVQEIILLATDDRQIRFRLGVGAGDWLFLPDEAARRLRALKQPQQTLRHKAVQWGFGHFVENLAVEQFRFLRHKPQFAQRVVGLHGERPDARSVGDCVRCFNCRHGRKLVFAPSALKAVSRRIGWLPRPGRAILLKISVETRPRFPPNIRNMNLDDAQKQKVAGWLAQGLKLSEIQKLLDEELGVRMTYLEVRLLVDDLKLMPQDTEPAPTPDLAAPAPANLPGGPARRADLSSDNELAGDPGDAPLGTGNVQVTLDQLARPGAVVSGQVTFGDGQSAQWYLDQMGRLGMVPAQKGYRPAEADIAQFQMVLEGELRKMGM